LQALHVLCRPTDCMIKSEIKNLPESQIELTVSVPFEKWKKFIDDAVRDFSKEIKVEGFRAGKAPRNLIEQKVGAGALLEEAANKAIRFFYGEIVKEKKLDVMGKPKATITKLAENNELEFTIVSAVVPVATLKPWRDAVKKVNKSYTDKKAEVSDQEIDKEIQQIANSRVQLVTVEREAKDGDSVLVDFQVKRDGVPIEHGTSKNHPLVLGQGVFIPGFEEQVVGMKAGEEKEFELAFPAEYHDKNIAGKPAQFSVKVNLVQERKTPEVSDEFARSLGKFEDLAALKKNVREGLLEEKEKDMKEKKRAEFIDALIKSLVVELPEVLVHEELHKMLNEFEMQLEGMGMGMTMESYLGQMKKTRGDIEKEWEPQAEKRVKAALALEEVAKEQEIEIPSEEVEAEMNKILAQYKDVKDAEKNIDLGRLYNYVKGTKQNEKVFELLESIK